MTLRKTYFKFRRMQEEKVDRFNVRIEKVWRTDTTRNGMDFKMIVLGQNTTISSRII